MTTFDTDTHVERYSHHDATADAGAPVAAPTQTVSACVTTSLRRYLADLRGEAPSNLHALVLEQVEKPMLEVVLAHAGGNRCKAAAMLGINRNTLRKKLQQYGLDD